MLIVLGTFVLEDAATVLAAMDVQVGRVALVVALASLYAGIVLGDLGLYGMGRLAAQAPWAARLVPCSRTPTGGCRRCHTRQGSEAVPQQLAQRRSA